jgi:tight adherence protein C
MQLAAFCAFASVFLLVLGPRLGARAPVSALARALGQVPLRQVAPLTLRGLIRLVRERVGKLLPGYELEDLRDRLRWAGRPWGLDAEDFLAVKVISGAALGVLLPLILRPGALWGLLLAAAGAMGGYALPDFWLRGKAQARQAVLRGQVPGFAELLAVACDAGLDLLGAVEAVSSRYRGLLGDEFARTRAEIMAGRPREEAYQDLAERNGCDELTLLVNAVSQAERYGTPVAEALKAQSRSLRDLARSRLQERAQALTVKIIFPVIVFVFLPLVVIILGPLLVNMMILFRQ